MSVSFSGPDMTIGLSINVYLHPKNQLDEVKQGWLVQTFGPAEAELPMLQRCEKIETEPPFLLVDQ